MPSLWQQLPHKMPISCGVSCPEPRHDSPSTTERPSRHRPGIDAVEQVERLPTQADGGPISAPRSKPLVDHRVARPYQPKCAPIPQRPSTLCISGDSFGALRGGATRPHRSRRSFLRPQVDRPADPATPAAPHRARRRDIADARSASAPSTCSRRSRCTSTTPFPDRPGTSSGTPMATATALNGAVPGCGLSSTPTSDAQLRRGKGWMGLPVAPTSRIARGWTRRRAAPGRWTVNATGDPPPCRA